jgi:hypothetical protein
MLLFTILIALAFGLVDVPDVLSPPTTEAAPWADTARPKTRDTVFLASNLSREQLVSLSASLAACRHPGMLLIDSKRSTPNHKLFLRAYKPDNVIPIGTFPETDGAREDRLGVETAPVIDWKSGPPLDLWKHLFPKAETVVICPSKPYRQLLQAACLAGSAQAPLYIMHGRKGEERELSRLLEVWGVQTIFAIDDADKDCSIPAGAKVVRLATESSIAAEHLRRQAARGPIDTIIIANPADAKAGSNAMSALAPWIASQRRAALLLTNSKGDNAAELVAAAIKKRDLKRVDNLIFVADLTAIPMEQRPNPIPSGKDPTIEMEPLTPKGNEPFTFAIGRLFNEDSSVVALGLARERLLDRERIKEKGRPRKALVVSNAITSDDSLGLPLLETFSRNTVQEFKNRGYQTTSLFGKAVTKNDLRKLLPDQDIFLWEGHHNTLIKEYQMHEWTEPLQPSLVFLQSCLALKDYKAQPILERGALCVVGSSTRIYSASGGAFALCFFDSLMYENQSTGASLRQAKNFLLAYSLLKEKRLGKDAKLATANLRSAWAFTLWGDPTLRLPPPTPPEDSLPAITHHVDGNTIHVYLPDQAHEKAITSRYKAQMFPNGRLAGLVAKHPEDKLQRLVPFVFAEIELPKVPGQRVPKLTTKLPSNRWVFCWDARRRCGYLLAAPRSSDRDELRFHVNWETRDVAAGEESD